MGVRLMNLRQIRDEKIPKGRSTILKLVKEGKFPAPVVSNPPAPSLWSEADVDAWVEAFVAEAKAAPKGNHEIARARQRNAGAPA